MGKMLLNEPFFTVYVCVLLFIMGSVLGSFINCVSGRIVSHENWMKGRSHCDSCGHVLEIRDLIPIISWVSLKGKCRYCGAKVSARNVVTEVFLGAIFVGIALVHGSLDFMVLRDCGLCVFLLGLSLVDLDSYEIPDGFVIAGIVWWVLTMPLVSNSLISYIKTGLIGAVGIAGSMLVLSLIMDRVLKKESMGGGDIKLLFMTGLYLGIGSGLFALIIACLFGLGFVIILRSEKIAFGPSISLATVVSLLIGSQIVSWYLSLF